MAVCCASLRFVDSLTYMIRMLLWSIDGDGGSGILGFEERSKRTVLMGWWKIGSPASRIRMSTCIKVWGGGPAGDVAQCQTELDPEYCSHNAVACGLSDGRGRQKWLRSLFLECSSQVRVGDSKSSGLIIFLGLDDQRISSDLGELYPTRRDPPGLQGTDEVKLVDPRWL